jgi:uncharacterized double-CXXCG motif protein
MTQLWRLEGFRNARGYAIDARHTWVVPGFDCPVCTAWGTSGVEYPSVDLAPYPWVGSFLDAWPVDPPAHERLRALIRPLLPDGSDPRPGCEIGPLRGHAAGRYPNFVWARWHTLAVDEAAAASLQGSGLGIPALVPTRLRERSRRPPLLRELEIWPGIDLDSQTWEGANPDTCPICGRNRGKATGFVMKADTLRPGLDLLRVRQWPVRILATARFKEFVEGTGLTGLEFTEVEVV